jgi:hypothetical protein
VDSAGLIIVRPENRSTPDESPGCFFMLDVNGNKFANGFQFDDCVNFKMVVPCYQEKKSNQTILVDAGACSIVSVMFLPGRAVIPSAWFL